MMNCSFRCNNICHAWKVSTYQCTHATSDDQCVDTCGEECVSCPINYVLKDPQTCVRPSDCVCMLPDGSTLGVSCFHLLLGFVSYIIFILSLDKLRTI